MCVISKSKEDRFSFSFFTRARLSLALLSLRKSGDYSSVYHAFGQSRARMRYVIGETSQATYSTAALLLKKMSSRKQLFSFSYNVPNLTRQLRTCEVRRLNHVKCHFRSVCD